MNLAPELPAVAATTPVNEPAVVRRTSTPVTPVVRKSGGTAGMLQVFTLIFWMGCLAIGTLGFVLPYSRPQPAPAELPPVQAEFLNIELSHDPLLTENFSPPSEPLPTPAPAEAIVQPSTAQPILVADPATVNFALPVQSAALVVKAAEATYSLSGIADAKPALPPMQHLTFGRGEGKQPAPDYPLSAQQRGQEGAVKVRLTVGADGRVLAAEAAEPSQWPVLNDSAVRTVRQRWRFSTGQMRLYEVLIRFQLNS